MTEALGGTSNHPMVAVMYNQAAVIYMIGSLLEVGGGGGGSALQPGALALPLGCHRAVLGVQLLQ